MGNPYDIIDYNIYMYDFSTKKETQITTSGTAFDPVIYGDTILYGRTGSRKISVMVGN